MEALARNNANVGAGYIETERRAISHPRARPGRGASTTSSNIVVGNRDGMPIYISDVADVVLGTRTPHRRGDRERRGSRARHGLHAHRRKQPHRLRARCTPSWRKSTARCPTGVVAKTVYNRTDLVNATINTVKKNLLRRRAARHRRSCSCCSATSAPRSSRRCVIPLSMLFTITGMVGSKISGNLMSLGALDFGLIVDGAVIIVENCIRRLAEEQHQRGRLLTRARALRDRLRRDQGSRHAQHLRRVHHHGGLSADPHAHRRRGQDVSPDGLHRHHRAARRDDLRRSRSCPRPSRIFHDRQSLARRKTSSCAARQGAFIARRSKFRLHVRVRRRRWRSAARARVARRLLASRMGSEFIPEPRRRRRRPARAAHSRHEPDAGRRDAARARKARSRSSRR